MNDEMRKAIKEAQKVLIDIPSINCGGCGISALSILRYLESKKIDTKEIEIVFMYDYYNNDAYHNNCNVIEGEASDLAVATHIALSIDDVVFDGATMFVDIMNYDINHSIENDVDKLVQVINNPAINGWNNWFDREEQIPEIEYMLDINLDDINTNRIF